jgi:hypothetical protein
MFGSSKDASQVKYFIIFLAKNKCFIKFKNASCYQAKLTKVHASRVLEEMTQMWLTDFGLGSATFWMWHANVTHIKDFYFFINQLIKVVP